MDSSLKRFLFLPFVVILGLLLFSAPGGGGEIPPIDASLPAVTETAAFALG
jgi:hypothetical protein